MSPKLLLLFCIAAIWAAVDCDTKISDDGQRARLPEFLTELDLASLEASEEDIESLKKVVKRLAPAKNGEYLMYQGVMGQPGVDFPVLTSIPPTKFSCRGVKGGYYADLESNCQVFHICDNGRKISFLCPNGTIFQQSQLICDWWFKVDCGKSAELYEQSAEQLAEDDRKRAEARKMNSEFHRTNEKNNAQAYYQTQNQNVEYDGRQNGRTNPFGQSAPETQSQEQQISQQSEEKNEQTNPQQNSRNGNQFGGSQNARGGGHYNQNYNYNQQSDNAQTGNGQQTSRQSFNSYNSRTGSQRSNKNPQDHFGPTSNSNAARDDKPNYRSPKAFGESGNNYNELTTTANPFREYQQPAESAAFATSRNNRYNKSYQYNQLGGYYSANKASTAEKHDNGVQGSFTPAKNGVRQNEPKNEGGLPFPTFAPIYKPRTTTTATTNLGVTTQKPYVNTDIYRHNIATQTPNANFETVTANPYQTTTQRYEEDNSGTNYRSYTQDTRHPSTQKPYVNTDTYRQGGGGFTATEAPTTWTSYDQTATTGAPKDGETSGTVSLTTDDYAGNTVTGSRWNTVTEVTPSAIGVQGSTQKPFGNVYQNAVTARNLRPYDTSFTYMNGKISSTLGPYLPFTKNYAYTTTTTTTTAKPPVYTATVPTIPDHRKPGDGGSTTETTGYFGAGTTPVKGLVASEREHVIGMLHSLQELEATAPTTDGGHQGSRIGLEIPPSSGPSTLHTLALYFATASDDFDSNESSTDTVVRVDAVTEEEVATTEEPSSAELPTSLLTRNTLNSYADLFNINSALQNAGNTTTGTRVAEDDDGEEDGDNDLDIQQSQGPVSGDNQRTGNPKLRELAQVFTHALSAYLQDPETFRKVLTEIRPTEPPTTLASENTESTTLYPTTQDDYPSATKEKDEVLDFSDVTKASRRKKLTTPYPTTTPTFTTPLETTVQPYYTTPEAPRLQQSTLTPNFIDESLNEAQSSDFRSSDEPKMNDFAHEVNHAFRNSNSNELRNLNVDVTGPSGSTGPSGPSATHDQYDSYVPGNRFGGFQNNSARTRAPYGEGVRPAGATPIGDNYVPEPTPASYSEYADIQLPINDDPLTEFGYYERTETLVTSGPAEEEARTLNSEAPSAPTTSGYLENEVATSTSEPFRINYYESPTKQPRYKDEILVTAGTVYPAYRNSYNDIWLNEKSAGPETTTDYPGGTGTTQGSDNSDGLNQQASTNRWTASPTVTRLWESTVFLDPEHINQGLTTSGDEPPSTVGQASGTTPVPGEEIFATDASGIGKTNQRANTDSPAWRWAPNENDSPTAFTLLPTVYSTENTATPAPTYTTHSSVTRTVTSSVGSPANTGAQEMTFPVRINVSAFNVTENEIVRAQEMFGSLNATSTNTLMRVMKQADSNSTVRQLVLLLISHCKGPMNKTMEEEKEQLLDALLRMPVNGFSSDESRDIIDGINKLQLPIGRNVGNAVSSTAGPTTTVSVTTYRSRRGRKYRPSTAVSTIRGKSGDVEIAETSNSISIGTGSSSDNRALELLRSLYTIAAKWG